MSAPENLPPIYTPSERQWSASLTLGFDVQNGATRLCERKHRGPLRVQKALYPEGERICHAILLHPPGGIAHGDQLAIGVTVAEGAHALLTTPGAGKWYGNRDAQLAAAISRQDVHLTVLAGAKLEWLPQENIVFDGANAASTLNVHIETGGSALGWDIICLGRPRSAAPFTTGRWQQGQHLRYAGKTVFREQGQLIGGDALLTSPIGLAGHTVCATFWWINEDIDPALLAVLREIPLPATLRAGTTHLPHILLTRVLGNDAETVRDYLTKIWHKVREVAYDYPSITPRIWST